MAKNNKYNNNNKFNNRKNNVNESADNQETETLEHVSNFEKYRATALKLAGKSGQNTKTVVTDEPWVLGEELGFNPPVVVEKPSFLDRVQFQRVFSSQDVVEILRFIFKEDTARVLVALDGEGDDAELIALGLVADFFEHFYGVGFDEVVGGFIKSQKLLGGGVQR